MRREQLTPLITSYGNLTAKLETWRNIGPNLKTTKIILITSQNLEEPHPQEQGYQLKQDKRHLEENLANAFDQNRFQEDNNLSVMGPRTLIAQVHHLMTRQVECTRPLNRARLQVGDILQGHLKVTLQDQPRVTPQDQLRVTPQDHFKVTPQDQLRRGYILWHMPG